MTTTAPARRFWHDDRRIPNAGGIAADSATGSIAAASHGYRWIDQDGQLTHRTRKGARLGRFDRDLVWVNAHGNPWLPAYLHGRRFAASSLEDVPASAMLRTARDTFAQNARLGLNTEWEVKDIRPLAGRATLRRAMRLLASDAAYAYGTNWRQHVEVKVLNTLHGGLPYALKVLRAAKAAEFTTMLLNHTGRPVVIGPVRARYVDLVRGPWRKRGIR